MWVCPDVAAVATWQPASMSTPATLTKPTIAELVDLSGKTAIVTGGSMGIGCGIVERLHEAGARVLIADIDLDAGIVLAERAQHRAFR